MVQAGIELKTPKLRSERSNHSTTFAVENYWLKYRMMYEKKKKKSQKTMPQKPCRMQTFTLKTLFHRIIVVYLLKKKKIMFLLRSSILGNLFPRKKHVRFPGLLQGRVTALCSMRNDRKKN